MGPAHSLVEAGGEIPEQLVEHQRIGAGVVQLDCQGDQQPAALPVALAEVEPGMAGNRGLAPV